MRPDRRGGDGLFVRQAAHVPQPARHDFVRAFLDRGRFGTARRTAMRRVVLEAAVRRRIVRRRHDDAVRKPRNPSPVVCKYGVRHGRRRRDKIARRKPRGHAVRGKHFNRSPVRRRRQCMRIHADEKRPVDTAARAVFADGLRDRGHVIFVERAVFRFAAMPGSPERHRLRGIARIRFCRIIRVDQRADVFDEFVGNRHSGEA